MFTQANPLLLVITILVMVITGFVLFSNSSKK